MVPIILLSVGYAVFYWGLHHFPGYHRYSLFVLLGLDGAFKNSPSISNPLPQKGIQFGPGGGLGG